MVTVLSVVIPAAFVTGVVARRPVPIDSSISRELLSEEADFGRIVWNDASLWSGKDIVTFLRRDRAGAISIEFMFRHIVRPDVLVYWVPPTDGSRSILPDQSRLIGAFAHRVPLVVPEGIRGQSGRLLLYSLADHEVIATSKPVAIYGK
jgi:hypothetical protein